MKKSILLQMAVIFCMIFSCQNSNAQCNPVGSGSNGGIHCMYPDTVHNCLYVGGGFQFCGTDTMNHCTYWNDTTYMPMGMMGNNGCNDSVWCFTYFNGSLYIGGNFTMAGGIGCNHIARWDGTSWYAVGNGFNEPVNALCVYDNELFAGGEFTLSGTTPVNFIGKWNGSQWSQVDGGTNNDVEAMCVWNNDLYMGGEFTLAGTVTVNRICKWDGTNFSAVGSGFTAGMNGQCMVHSLCVYNGNLCAGGMFEHVGSMEVHNLAMWNGSVWASFGNIDGGMWGDNQVGAMCVYNGQLCIGGNFGSCGSSSANNLGMWNGSSWLSIGTGMNGMVNSLAVFHNELYIAGSFTNAAGTSVNNIAKYSSATGIQPLMQQPLSVEIYPNPSSDFIAVSWSNEKSSAITFTALDITGRKVLQQDLGTMDAGYQKQIISLSNLSNGMYFLTLHSSGKKYTAKFQITK